MSGFEVIGVIASASQLVHYVLEIIDYTRKRPFDEYSDHLEALVSAVKVVTRTPSLQTQPIKDFLDILLRRTEILKATLELYSVNLSRKFYGKLWTALCAHRAESQILKDLATLERDKSNLLLCITSSNGAVLYGIQGRTTPNLCDMDGETIRKVSKATDTPKPEALDVPFEADRRPKPLTMQKERHQDGESGQSMDTRHATTKPVIESQLGGNMYRNSTATDAGSVYNRPYTFDNNGQRRDVYDGNRAEGPGSAVFNGPSTRDELKDFWARNPQVQR